MQMPFLIFVAVSATYSRRRNYQYNEDSVSTKWLNLLRKICAIFAQIFFCELLRYFAHETQ